MREQLAKLDAAARRLAHSPIPTAALVSVDDPRRASEAIDRLVGTVLRTSELTWRVQSLDLVAKPDTFDQARREWSSNSGGDAGPLLVIFDLSQASVEQAERHEAQLRKLNALRDLMPQWDERGGALVIVVPVWLGRRFAELAPDTYSILGPIVDVAWGQRERESDEGVLQAMRERFEERLSERPEAPARYALGTYEFAYRFCPPTPRLDGDATLERLAAVRGYTGWRPWWVPTRDAIRPRILHEGHGSWGVECWMFDNHDANPAHSDYWLVFNSGDLYLLRGYDEDSYPDRVEPGAVFSVNLPLWRTAEALLHATDYTAALGVPDTRIDFFARWTGLHGRELTGWPDAWDHAEGKSATDVADAHVEFVASSLESMSTLTSVVHELTAPLFERFDGHRSTRAHVEGHLEQMMKR